MGLATKRKAGYHSLRFPDVSLAVVEPLGVESPRRIVLSRLVHDLVFGIHKGASVGKVAGYEGINRVSAWAAWPKNANFPSIKLSYDLNSLRNNYFSINSTALLRLRIAMGLHFCHVPCKLLFCVISGYSGIPKL